MIIAVLAFALAMAQSPDDVALMQRAYAARTTPEGGELQKQVIAKLPQLNVDFESLLASGSGDALRFAIPYAYFLRSANDQKRALDVLTRALDAPGSEAASADREHALYDAGVLAFRQDDEKRSRAFNEESLRVARQLGDRGGEASALIGLSRIALRHHDYKTVKTDAGKAAQLRRTAGDEHGAISALHMVAAAERMSGQDARAQELYESTLANFRTSGNEGGVSGELYNLGYVHLHQGHLRKAKELFGEALQRYVKIKDDASTAYCLTGFAAIAAVEKDGARAAQLYGAAAATLDRLGIRLDPDDQLDWDRYTSLARRELKQRYEVEFASGRALTLDSAVALTK